MATRRRPAGRYAEVRISAADLPAPRRFLYTYAELTVRAPDGRTVSLGTTESVAGEASPAYIHPYELPLTTAEDADAPYTVTIWAVHRRHSVAPGEKEKAVPIGHASLSLRAALATRDGVVVASLGPAAGSLVLVVEALTPTRPAVSYNLTLSLAAGCGIGGPPVGRGEAAAVAGPPPAVFFVIYRAMASGALDADWVPVFRSEGVTPPHRGSAGDVTWATASLSAEALCAGDECRALRIEWFHTREGAAGGRRLAFVQTSASAFRYARPGGLLRMVGAEGVVTAGTVGLVALKNGLVGRAGRVSSVFILRVESVVWDGWGQGVGRRRGGGWADYIDRDVDGRKRVGKDDAGSEWETDSEEEGKREEEGGEVPDDGLGEKGGAGAAEKQSGGVSYLAARATDVGVGADAGRPLPRGVRQA
ncbi:hypothetical protein MMPV_001590 [Pyropia vietnamensis]